MISFFVPHRVSFSLPVLVPLSSSIRLSDSLFLYLPHVVVVGVVVVVVVVGVVDVVSVVSVGGEEGGRWVREVEGVGG